MTFDTPPRLTGEEKTYAAQMYSFLYQLCEKLNVAMDALDSGTFSDTSVARKGAAVKSVPGTSGQSWFTPELKQSYEELKSLIMNTAEYSRTEIALIGDALNTTDGRVTAVTTRTTAVEGRTTTLEGGLNTTNGNVTSLEGRTGSLESGLASTNNTVSSVSSVATAASTKANTLEQSLGVTNTNVATVSGVANAASAKANTLETSLATTNSNVSALDTRAGTLESGLSTTNGNVSALGTRTGNLETGLAATNGNVSALGDRTDDLEDGLEETNENVTSLETQLGTIDTRTGTLETGMTTVQAEIDTANATASDHWNSFLSFQQNTTSATTQLEYGIARMDEYMSSQFGYYGEQWTNLKGRTESLEEQQLTYDSLLVAQQAEMAGFNTYRMTTEGFIRQGFVYQEDGETPVIGIAIGQNATTSVTKTIDGVTYYQANTEEALAFYTAQKVSFYLHGREVAYISNDNLYINSANIINDVTVGSFKFISSATTGLSIKWVGANA